MSDIYYSSTRSNDEKISFSEAVVKGIASDGGLYVPSKFPKLDLLDKNLIGLSYQELANKILGLFVNDFSDFELKACIEGAYDAKFRNPKIAPIKICGNTSFIELYHGKTLAFKDIALSILPYLLKTAAKKINIKEEIVILTATSGDTGKAALEGFANVEGVKIIVFYPTDGVSDIQKRQMITQEGNNVEVFGINGNFDDAQNGVKNIFTDVEFNKELKNNGYVFSSANSINIGRLIPQIVYYFSSYFTLVKEDIINLGDKINVVVPTGNFGNILASYYAKKMGLPVNKFICASNANNILTDFINTGVYDLEREFKTTISPSMDILISSNLERFLYEISNQDTEMVSNLMESLIQNKKYEISNSMKKNMNCFYGGYTDDIATVETIGQIYKEFNYIVDTHTAVAYQVHENYVKKTGDNTHAIIASTASPFKFTRSVVEAIGINADKYNDFELVDILAKKANLEIPAPILNLNKKKILHDTTCRKNEMKKVIREVLK